MDHWTDWIRLFLALLLYFGGILFIAYVGARWFI